MDCEKFVPVLYPFSQPLLPGKIYIHMEADKELKKQFEGSGQKARFMGLLEQRLIALNTHREHACSRMPKNQFKNLKSKKAEDLYRISLGSIQKNFPNFRIIYCFEGQYIYLLYAFVENNDGDYDNAIEVSRKRKKALQGGRT